MRDFLFGKEAFVIFFFVQSYDSLDIKLLKYVDILVRVVTISLVSVPLLDWSHESHELSWNNPVKIAVFDSLVLLVLLDIEGLEVIPLELDGVPKSLKALQHGTLIEAVPFRGISIGFEKTMIWLEDLICLFSGVRDPVLENVLEQHNDLKSNQYL